MDGATRTIIVCVRCAQKLRVPTDRGELRVRCPKCRHKWDWGPPPSTVTSTASSGTRPIHREYIPAFSVKQPWAGLLLAGVKRFEVRTWAPQDTGLFFVHASSGKAQGIRELRANPLFQRAIRHGSMSDESQWHQSAFLGLVDVVRVIAPEDELPADLTEEDRFLCGQVDGVFLWEVGQRWVFPAPVPCHGKLNLWPPPDELLPALNTQLRLAGANVEATPMD